MKRLFTVLLALVVIVSCGPRGPKGAPVQATREFPYIEVPDMYEEPDERVDYFLTHFWDKFLKNEPVYQTDTVVFNGVPKDELEQAMGTFVSVLRSAENGAKAMPVLHEKLCVYDAARGDSVYDEMCRLVEKYLYNPSSPVRDEELYLPFISAKVDAGRGTASDKFAAKVCALNRPGTKAADFGFIDTKGRRRTLHGIKANFMILIFGNPDCEACREMVEYFDAVEGLNNAVRSGRVSIVDVYTDEDLAAWKAGIDSYPSNWLCGYDPEGIINSNTIYAVRAVPSVYILDKDKKVIAKDIETSALDYYLSQVL